MSEINTVQGKIEIKGTVHGAINTIVFLFASPQDWEFKQFISQEELEQYAFEHHLQVVSQKPEHPL